MTVSTIFSQLMTFATKLSMIVDHNKPKSPMRVSGHCVEGHFEHLKVHLMFV